MHPAVASSSSKSSLAIADSKATFVSMAPAVAALTRPFFAGAGVLLFRCLLMLALCSAVLQITLAPALAQTETVLYSFCQSSSNCSDGSIPYAGLTPDGRGNFYGTTFSGGRKTFGTVFEVSPNANGGWNESVIHNFAEGPDGGFPIYSGVIFDTAGNLYGTTYIGGKYKQGVVYELSPDGTNWKETILHTFTGGADGGRPEAGLVMDKSGNLYGVTIEGGSNNHGTIFELSPSDGIWTEQVLREPGTEHGALTIDAEGNLYGITVNTVFQLSADSKGVWKSTTIHAFDGPSDGRDPQGTLVFDTSGNLYGTTYSGGVAQNGTVFKLTPDKKGAWTETILHSFQGGKEGDGSNPFAGILLDKAGNVYGTTIAGGEYEAGTVFELVAPIRTAGYTEKILWSFDKTDGFLPYGSLILDAAGNLYGTGAGGGVNDYGVVFEVTP
ncbi:MAG: choice-of-anchor tandem repeat GloVer-containing protein [Terriglobales bacterium]